MVPHRLIFILEYVHLGCMCYRISWQSPWIPSLWSRTSTSSLSTAPSMVSRYRLLSIFLCPSLLLQICVVHTKLIIFFNAFSLKHINWTCKFPVESDTQSYLYFICRIGLWNGKIYFFIDQELQNYIPCRYQWISCIRDGWKTNLGSLKGNNSSPNFYTWVSPNGLMHVTLCNVIALFVCLMFLIIVCTTGGFRQRRQSAVVQLYPLSHVSQPTRSILLGECKEGLHSTICCPLHSRSRHCTCVRHCCWPAHYGTGMIRVVLTHRICMIKEMCKTFRNHHKSFEMSSYEWE